MNLTIDNQRCELYPGQTIRLDYRADELSDVQSSEKGFSIPLRLPATLANDQVFGLATDPCTGDRFNAVSHTATLTVDGAVILSGRVALLSAQSDPAGGEYLIEIRGHTSDWAKQASSEVFSTLGVGFSERLTPATIVQSWTNSSPVKFFPVVRDEYTPELSSAELAYVERILSIDDYHPFLSLEAAVKALFAEAGYTLRSEFINSEFFRSLYMSGAYSSRDTNALRRHMDFFARRKKTASTTANSIGRVYASPFVSANSVGGFIETASPGEVNENGDTLTDVFTNNHCFKLQNGEFTFTPKSTVTTGFEYCIRYITGHRILSRTRFKGIDSVYLGDNTDVQMALANRYVDRRNEIQPYFQYRAIVFDHVAGTTYRLTCTRDGVAGQTVGDFSTRSALLTTPSATRVQNPVLLYKPSGSSAFTTYTGDWALYDGYIGETGQTEVEMILHTNPVTVTPSSPKKFSPIYFYGAEAGMNFSLSAKCTLRPDFSSAPGLNSTISFRDVSRHNIRRRALLEALQHLFNLRFYTDEQTRTVYLEPADDFYRLGGTFDWSAKIDHTHPILLEDIARETARERTYKYRTEDGTLTRLNETLAQPLGELTATCDSAAAEETQKSLVNPLFCATVNEPGHYTNAPSASLMKVGDRDDNDTADRCNFSPRIVRYLGLQPLPAGERWGFPSNGDSYPLTAFCRSDSATGFTLGFEDFAGFQGLNRYYQTEWEQQRCCQRITLHLRLEPHDIEHLFRIQPDAPSIASVFRLKINGEPIDCTLHRIEGYDPTKPSTRCIFTRLPNL